MKRSKKKILLVSNANLTFIEDDYKILSSVYKVDWIIISKPTDYIKLLRIIHYDIVYCWLAHYHSFIAGLISVLLRKFFIIHIGGHEVSTIKELKFGAKAKRLRFYAIYLSLYFCRVVISAGEHLKTQLEQIYPFLTGKVQVINHGFDLNFWEISSNEKKKSDVLTVIADSHSHMRISIKGIPIFISAAQLLPKLTFTIVGIEQKYLEQFYKVPENIHFINHLRREELLIVYQNHKVYCQLSLSEGFGMALCEAMLCGCIPVVSQTGMMPEIIGNSGYSVEIKNIQGAVIAIKQALSFKPIVSPREQILNKFDILIREQSLLKLMSTPGN